MKSNCFIFGLFKWWHYGGYLIIRKSKYGWWPHFMWTKDIGKIEVEEFIPIESKRKLIFPPLFFKGHVQVKKGE